MSALQITLIVDKLLSKKITSLLEELNSKLLVIKAIELDVLERKVLNLSWAENVIIQ